MELQDYLSVVDGVLSEEPAAPVPLGPLMSLGMFVFTLRGINPDQIQQRLAWRYGSNNRVGQRPTLQFLGEDTEQITLPGTLYPGFTGGDEELANLRSMADAGESYALITGFGEVLGHFVIDGIDTTRSNLFGDGKARKIEFSITLKRVDDLEATA